VDARPPRRDVTAGDRHAVVAGAGIGGAAAALLLANAGWRVSLFERVAEPRAVGAGILLQPNGLAVLYGLGLRDALRRRAVEARRGHVADATGRVLLTSAIPDFGGGYDHMLVLRRSHLQAVLLDAVAAHERIASLFGCEVVAARPDGAVIWRDGDGEEAIGADLVVGADGLHSRVRDGGRFGVRFTPGLMYLRALGAPVARAMTEYWTSLGIFGGGPVDGALYFYASIGALPVADALRRRDLGALAAAWAAACPPAGEAFRGVERFEDLLVNQVMRVDCERWHDGSIVLLGDAAHAMAPNAGQGANSALVDAAVLVDALAASETIEAALDAYERRRRVPVRRVQDASALLGRLGEVQNPLLRRLRDNAVRLVLGRFGADRSMRASQQEEPTWLEGVARRRTTT
jgi:2-polyprenyl-6-methoxyphenol hydroxylase-like FAD-dependent oxidoreductase